MQLIVRQVSFKQKCKNSLQYIALQYTFLISAMQVSLADQLSCFVDEDLTKGFWHQ